MALYLCIKITGNFKISEVYTPIKAHVMQNLQRFYFVLSFCTYIHVALFPHSEMSLHVYKTHNT